MYELKPLSRDAVPRALQKAERYRLLNEPAEAESICLDILHVDPENQTALVTLLLALTERFDRHYAVGTTQPEDVIARLKDPYERTYFSGVVAERRAKSQLRRGIPADVASGGFRTAMEWYEKARALSPAGNEDAILRWNTCARILRQNRSLDETPEERSEPAFE